MPFVISVKSNVVKYGEGTLNCVGFNQFITHSDCAICLKHLKQSKRNKLFFINGNVWNRRRNPLNMKAIR
jgi:hypothetical protein